MSEEIEKRPIRLTLQVKHAHPRVRHLPSVTTIHRLKSLDRSHHYAYLLAGSNPCFQSGFTYFTNYLVSRLGFVRENIRVASGYESSTEAITKDFEQFVLGTGAGGMLLLYYNGHGGWGTMEAQQKPQPYLDLLRPMMLYHGPKIFINHACRARTAEGAMLELGLLPERALLIAACDTEENTVGNAMYNLMVSHWDQGERFPEIELLIEHEMYGRTSVSTQRPVKIGRFGFEDLLINFKERLSLSERGKYLA